MPTFVRGYECFYLHVCVVGGDDRHVTTADGRGRTTLQDEPAGLVRRVDRLLPPPADPQGSRD